jgi:hypothetical protein
MKPLHLFALQATAALLAACVAREPLETALSAPAVTALIPAPTTGTLPPYPAPQVDPGAEAAAPAPTF